MERLQVDLEGTLYRTFKAQCALENTNMSDTTRELIGGWLNERVGDKSKVKVIQPIKRS